MNFKTILSGFLDNGSSKITITKTLADTSIQDKAALGKQKRTLTHTAKAIARTRQDIGKWNTALNLTNTDDPRNWNLQNLFDETGIDALLSSQLQNRLQKCLSMPFMITNEAGEKDEEQTLLLKKSAAYLELTTAIWEKRIYGYNLVELQIAGQTLAVNKLPRQNVVPRTGLFYPDYTEDTSIAYRTIKEFGKWILEFNSGDVGLINKAIPHVLFKRFAQSCWSELCEIYGIPPRVLQTNTQDAGMLNRGEAMMRDMSAAAWFIIDTEEKFEWAKGADTNGDVYKNLIGLCNNEMSLLITGAVIGQDTVNGNRSKDQSGKEQLNELVESDLVSIAQEWNTSVLPALVSIGFLKGTPQFQFEKVDDLKELWEITKGALEYYTIDPEWVKKKWGIEIISERKETVPGKDKKLKDAGGFFD